MLQFITAAESLFVSVHRDHQRLQMMALSGATPLKLVRAGVAVEATCFLVRKHESCGAGDVRLLTATPPSPPPGNEPGPGGEVPNLGGKRGRATTPVLTRSDGTVRVAQLTTLAHSI